MRMKSQAANLRYAQMDRTPIVIFIGAELVGSGVIDDITEMSVKIKGERYIREVCTFKYAGMKYRECDLNRNPH